MKWFVRGQQKYTSFCFLVIIVTKITLIIDDIIVPCRYFKSFKNKGDVLCL